MNAKLSISLLLAVLSISIGTMAQINVGSNLTEGGKFKEEDLMRLKRSTLVYFIRESEKGRIDEYQRVVDKVWTYCKAEVRPFAEFNELRNKPGYSFLMITPRHEAFATGTSGATGGVASRNPWGGVHGSQQKSIEYFFLQLWMRKNGKSEKDNKYYFSRVELNMDLSTKLLVRQEEPEKERYAPFYQMTDEIGNLNPGMLQTYLAIINRYLTEEKVLEIFEEHTDDTELKAMATDTLFIPEYVFQGTDKRKKTFPAELFRDYPYPYKVVGSEWLSDRILRGDTVKYLLFTENYNRITYTIYNSGSKQIVLSRTSLAASNLRSKDFADLARRIGKAKP